MLNLLNLDGGGRSLDFPQKTAKTFRNQGNRTLCPPTVAATEVGRAKEVVFRVSGTASSSASGGFAEVRGTRVFARGPVAMDALDKVLKPKTKRAKRFLEKREPKLNENIKNAMLIKGGNANATVTQVLRDVEFFSKKSDCSLFMFGSHNKKRPNNLVIGRMYDYHVLDMIELGIEKFVSLKDIKTSKCPEGTKPLLIFAGDDFDVTEDYRRLKNLLIDFFRGPTVSNVRLAGLEYVLHFTALNGKVYFRSYKGPTVSNVRLAGLEYVLHFTALNGKVYFRSYKLLLKKSGCRTPRIELEEMGPSLDLVLRRTHLASDDLYKLSMKMPKALKPKKRKNISQDTFGTTFGRIHMQKQDLSKLQTRKMKGLKKRPAEMGTEDEGKKSKRIKKTD
ncbi:Ribosome production factor 2-like protein [Microtus ochrogaster]|uniref:Ribosome production factor 2 homolog n=1 Tax=Microtus ochrogaster TaxID=79684 RepID=A0A8J6G8T2_MICOH|nr:Ribosome production factor 2-like protein [Microtus ochrogaster]